jgi:hypothetical protein
MFENKRFLKLGDVLKIEEVRRRRRDYPKA